MMPFRRALRLDIAAAHKPGRLLTPRKTRTRRPGPRPRTSRRSCLRRKMDLKERGRIVRGRDVVIGAAIGLWLAVAFPSHHAHVSPGAPRLAAPPSAAPLTSQPSPRAASPERPSATSPVTSTATLPAPERSRQQDHSPGISASHPGSAGGSWAIGTLSAAAIAVSALTVTVTARQLRRQGGPGG